MLLRFLLPAFLILTVTPIALAQPGAKHKLTFYHLPVRWDEGLPMGNGWLGCLAWQKDRSIRLSLDRADLWDLRPMKGLDRPEFSYQWVADQFAQGDYTRVQQYFDAPYEREAGPTKLPGAALEFALPPGVSGSRCELDPATGLSTFWLSNGVRLQIFVHARRQEGWFRFDVPKMPAGSRPSFPEQILVAPKYGGDARGTAAAGSVQGDDLVRLGYEPGTGWQGSAVYAGDTIRILRYEQPCWGGFRYEVAVASRYRAGGMEGVWCISSHSSKKKEKERAEKTVRKALGRGFEKNFRESAGWWAEFWAKSTINLPDSLLERQYYLDQYKFGCAARADAPMISLQAVWTADNGRLPPWKGDFHHDLNTQMSYWPAYTANHLDLATGYLNHLERNAEAHRRYTRKYFGTSGLNVPGVETWAGEPMGGWIQYACSPTTSAWLAHHFYLQWRYSEDRHFLKKHAWPWLHDVAMHLEQLSVLKDDTLRVLPLSSSPEINDNRRDAWFPNTWTNYDLALARFVFRTAAEAAGALGKSEEVRHWNQVNAQLPPFAVEGRSGPLKFAPELAYRESHRHFSHLMAIYPLKMFDRANGFPDRNSLKSSLRLLDSIGTSGWTGYSFAWLGCLRAQLFDGAGARDALRIFAEAFVSPNSFHLNGDQSGKGYSGMTYRPFTLEGNFAFAAGIQEMLLQSDDAGIRVFPAIPEDWKNVSFRQLRAQGAFLVDAEKRNGAVQFIRIKAENGGVFYLHDPEQNLKPAQPFSQITPLQTVAGNRIWKLRLKKGEIAVFGSAVSSK